MKHYYQLVRDQGRYDLEYTVYEARQGFDGGVQIAAMPLVLIGNHPDEIKDTMAHVARDIKKYPVVDKSDCDIFHDNLLHYTDDSILDEEEDIDDETLLRELGYNDR